MLSRPRRPSHYDKGTLMRRFFLCLCLLGLSSQAVAADLDWPLRGSARPSSTVPAWGGFYAGGQAGYSTAGADFKNSVNDLAAEVVRNTFLESIVANLNTLSGANTNGIGYGGFFGYNSYWEGAVLGVEFNYSRTSLNVGDSDSIPPLLISNDSGAPAGHHFTYGVNLTGNANLRITDLATFRARGGWAAGQFMPYAFFGVAVARADVSRSATVTWTRTDNPDAPLVPLPDAFGGGTKSDVQNGGFYFGYAGGLGLDVFLMPNVFVRGEWEYVGMPIQSMHVNINTVRGAVGVKF
jgi:opacity protein-like surface antigen